MCGDDVCLPVYTEDSIFPPDVLSEFEDVASTELSTRPSKGDCNDCDGYFVDGTCVALVPQPPSPPKSPPVPLPPGQPPRAALPPAAC